MKIAVVGTGYVGLVTGTCLAGMGNDVICTDADASKIRGLSNGIVPIHEPELEDMITANVRGGRLSFTADPIEATRDARIIFLTVDTPPCGDGSPDLSHLLAAARQTARTMDEYTVIAIKSTVPAGTARKVAEYMARESAAFRKPCRFDVVSNPEFLREGSAIHDFMRPDRIVVGADSDRASRVMLDLYDPLIKSGHPAYLMDTKSAEMTKYAANCMLATRISFMNEVALLCERTGADISSVRRGIGSDSRIGMSHLDSGLGFGGSCFSKDLGAFIHSFSHSGLTSDFFKAVEAVNIRQRRSFIERILSVMGADLAGATVAIWGLAFKPDTDDMRDAPSIDVIRSLIRRGAVVRAWDPHATEVAKRVFADIDSGLEFARDMYQCLEMCDCLVVATEWDDFRRPDFGMIGSKLRRKLVFDGRNIFEPGDMAALGFEYHSVGRKTGYPGTDSAGDCDPSVSIDGQIACG